ncbi:MAG: isopentenyl phosphate kinase [Candidatus Micrarchaeia archaeon]|jgi:isopentenyl phosphate kinase
MICVIKVGGSSFSDKKSGKSYVDKVAKILASELTPNDKFVIIQGAGYIGHKIAKEKELAKLENNQISWAYLRNEVMRVSAKFIDKLIKSGKPAVYIATSSIAHMKEGKLLALDIKPIKGFVENGFIPFLHSDAPIDEVHGLSILSGDILAEKIAELLGADMLIYGTDVDGVLDENKKVIPELRKEEIDKIKYWKVDDVSGGIQAKLRFAAEAASKGIKVMIINLRKKGNLSRAIAGENIGTRIV